MSNYYRVGVLLFALVLFVPIGAVQGKSIMPKACPVPVGKPQLEMASDLAGYAKAIESFLSQGGTVKQLEAILIERKMIPDSSETIKFRLSAWYYNRGGIRQGDLDGDGYLDIVVILAFSDGQIGDADVFPYLCAGNHYRFVGSPIKREELNNGIVDNRLDVIPKFVFVGDMNNDGNAELVYDVGLQGATTIFNYIEFMHWNRLTQKLESLYDGKIEYPAEGGSYFVTEPNSIGLRSLIVRTGFSGSGIASGPQRQHTITYSWNGTKFIEANIVSDPPTDRIHAAYDGLYHLNKGHLDEALRLYWRALYDKQIKDWSDDTRSTAQAHAAYGIIVASAKRFGIYSNEARDAVQRMAAFEAKYKGDLWFKYAHLFWETAQSSNDIHAACKAVNDAFQADYDAQEVKRLDGLGLWPMFGYNINWTPLEKGLSFCPF